MNEEQRYYGEARLVGWIVAHPAQYAIADNVPIYNTGLAIILDEIRALDGESLLTSPRLKGLLMLDECPIRLANDAYFSTMRTVQTIAKRLIEEDQ